MHTISNEDLERETGALYRKIAAALRRARNENRFEEGAKLPPIRELAYQLSTTPNTIARAYQLLIAEGDAEARVGDGTYFIETSKTSPAIEIRETILGGLPDESTTFINMRSANTCLVGTEQDMNAALRDVIASQSFAPDSYAHESYRQLLVDEIIQHDKPSHEFGALTLCHGAVNAMFVAILALTTRSQKSTILTEEFCYTGFRSAKYVSRLNSVNLPMDDEGVLPDALERACQSGDVLGFMTSSITQNPTTITTSFERRRAIAALAQKYDFHILDDIVYSRFADPHIRKNGYETLCPERLWQIDSVSKLGYSNLRVGWVISPKSYQNVGTLLHALSVNLSDLNILLLLHLFRSGAITRAETNFKSFIEHRHNIIAPKMSQWTDYLHPTSPFFWLPLPKGLSAVSFAEALDTHNIKISPGILFSSVHDAPAISNQFARVSFSQVQDDETLRFAIDKIDEILHNPPMTQMVQHV